MERGVIRNKQHVQINDFSGLKWGTITPTDIDGLIDFGNKCFIFIELKHGNAKMPRGQQLALERVCDAIKDIPAWVLVASHQTPQDEDVNTANAEVIAYRYQGQWQKPKQKTTVKQAIEIIRRITFQSF